MEYVNLLVEIADEIALLTVNRPQALNALNLETLKELRHFFTAVQEDAGVKVVIVTGAGEKAFVAGGDLAGMAPMGPLAARESALLAQEVLNRIEQGRKPVIAAVNGYALGAGAELAIASDFILMAESAQIGLPEISIGTFLGGGVTHLLPQLVGLVKARELVFLGDRIDGTEAHEIGRAHV